MLRPLQAHVQPVARWFAIATFVVVAVKLIDEPGSNALSEPRQGLLIALGASAVLVASTMTVAAAPVRRKATVKHYTPPPAPDYAPDGDVRPAAVLVLGAADAAQAVLQVGRVLDDLREAHDGDRVLERDLAVVDRLEERGRAPPCGGTPGCRARCRAGRAP